MEWSECGRKIMGTRGLGIVCTLTQPLRVIPSEVVRVLNCSELENGDVPRMVVEYVERWWWSRLTLFSMRDKTCTEWRSVVYWY